MKIRLHGQDIEVKRVSESYGVSRRLSIYCEEKDLETLHATVEAHGVGNPIVVIKDDGSTLTYKNGYTRIDGIERTIASGEDDITRIDLNLTEKAPDEDVVVEPDAGEEAEA